MKFRMLTLSTAFAVLLSIAAVAQTPASSPPAPDTNGFITLFDGKTLEGWKAEDMSYWSVEDGAITAKITPEHPLKRNYYLVWQGGQLGDFQLILRHRVIAKESVNSGFQFRSEMFDGDIKQDCRGYQADNQSQTPWLVRLYDEWGRHDLALRGEKTTFDAEGKKTVTPIAEATGPAWFKLEEWHEYDLTCKGTHLTLKIDGRLAAETDDNDPKQQDLSGILGLQLHSGPPMTVQFKDIRVKKLN